MDDIREILTGGQSFSWSEEEDCFTAVSNEKVYRVQSESDFYSDDFLRVYYDFDFDYDRARCEIREKDELLKQAVDNFPKLRILRQDPWITLISFILSQNNNIKRIISKYS